MIKSTLPRILIIGENPPFDIVGNSIVAYESNKYDIQYIENEDLLYKYIVDFKPDFYVTIGDDFNQFKKMMNLSYDFRRKWVHTTMEGLIKQKETFGDMLFYNLNRVMLDNFYEHEPLLSIFTSVYKTGDNIYKTYRSVISQSYKNWEWVILDDAYDEDTTRIINELKYTDPRIKVYSFEDKSKGIIGDAKWKAASLCNGLYLMELDHDDVLTPDAVYLAVKAFKEYPDAGFVYSDSVECDLNYNYINYGETFAMGYGTYYETEVEVDGVAYKVNSMADAHLNPKTIRHIVGVPNHFRTWKRDVYFKVGGHNRSLTIADDYELIVKTFLETRFVRVPKCCYVQYYYGQNTQNANNGENRKDIQRRVKYIANFYNERIKNRFEELGYEDWAYKENPTNPLLTESKIDSFDFEYTLNLNI